MQIGSYLKRQRRTKHIIWSGRIEYRWEMNMEDKMKGYIINEKLTKFLKQGRDMIILVFWKDKPVQGIDWRGMHWRQMGPVRKSESVVSGPGKGKWRPEGSANGSEASTQVEKLFEWWNQHDLETNTSVVTWVAHDVGILTYVRIVGKRAGLGGDNPKEMT